MIGLYGVQVLLAMKYAPIDVADAYTSLMGGTFSDVSEGLPYTAGHHGVASVMKVGTSLHKARMTGWCWG